MAKYIIGVDIGTQSLRTGIFREDGELVAVASEQYETIYDKINHATQNPRDWWQAFKKTLRACLNNELRENIAGIAVCTTSSTVIPAKKDGTPQNDAILWMDKRAYRETNEINATGNERLKYAGGGVSAEWLLPKMLWLKKNKPGVYNDSDYVIEALDWFNYKLTGKWVLSKCNISCKWAYLDREDGWDDDFMAAIGLSDYHSKWPDTIKKVGEVIGTLDPKVAFELDLPGDTIVVQGGIDAHIALLGMGVTDSDELGMITGSSFVHLLFTDEPVFNNKLWGPYSNPLIDGYWLSEGGQTSGGAIMRWFKDNFGRDLANREKNSFDILSEEAARVSPGAEGLVVLDFWQGNRTPYKDPLMSGNILGLRMKHERGHVYRALLESVAYGTNNIIKNMETREQKVKQITICGGPTKDELWMQIISDVTGVKLQVPDNNEAGLMGCALAVAKGTGTYATFDEAADKMVAIQKEIKPDKETHEQYKFYFNKYLELNEKLREDMHDIITETNKEGKINE
ncbi:MAG: FGGY-family carbohydrate kinase [Halanaerobiales bacterium]